MVEGLRAASGALLLLAPGRALRLCRVDRSTPRARATNQSRPAVWVVLTWSGTNEGVNSPLEGTSIPNWCVRSIV